MLSTPLLFVLLITFSACISVDVTLDIGSFPDGVWKISPYLASMSLVYAWAPGLPLNPPSENANTILKITSKTY